jgi:hypothetical protein
MLTTVRQSLMFGTACVMVLACGHSRTSAAKLDGVISEVLPVGTDRERVVTVLDSMRIEHSAFHSSTDTIIAIVRDVSRTLTTRQDIQVVFKFDHQGKLHAHTVEDIFTGP